MMSFEAIIPLVAGYISNGRTIYFQIWYLASFRTHDDSETDL